jgi:endonuclease YncB( thermonuclease family)
MRLIVAVLLMTLTAPVWADELRGSVLAVVDGETFLLLAADNSQHRIRLVGIDAPEKDQPFEAKSKQNLTKLTHGGAVRANCPKRDSYGWQLCKVYVRGIDVGLRQIHDGMAWWYRAHAPDQSPADRQRYAREEYEAREAKRGLWADASPTPPWEWRAHRQRKR